MTWAWLPLIAATALPGQESDAVNRRLLSVAPMMDWTDRHCRYFHRLLAPSAVLYTEMITTGAILHGDRDYLLAFNPEEHPLALQVGGSDPLALAACARIAESRGFDEINLNVGCPSDRVQQGRFGACLMREPALVRDCVAAMRDATGIEVTVKTRLGVDDLDSFQYFSDFVHTVAEAGCRIFAVHARKAWLSGLSPKENREIPELRPDWVHQLKRNSPELTIIINGGIRSLGEVKQNLDQVDGVMLGRAAYQNPWLLAECEAALAERSPMLGRTAVVAAMTEYAYRQAADGTPIKHISRHLIGLFQGMPGARTWRRHLTEWAIAEPRDHRILDRALARMAEVFNPGLEAA